MTVSSAFCSSVSGGKNASASDMPAPSVCVAVTSRPYVEVVSSLLTRGSFTIRGDRLEHPAELAPDEPCIKPIAGDERCMAAGLDDMPAVEHHEKVGVAHG